MAALKHWMGNNYVYFGTGPLVCVVCTETSKTFAWVYDGSGTPFVSLIYRFFLCFPSSPACLPAHPLSLVFFFFFLRLMQMVLVVRGEVTAMQGLLHVACWVMSPP